MEGGEDLVVDSDWIQKLRSAAETLSTQCRSVDQAIATAIDDGGSVLSTAAKIPGTPSSIAELLKRITAIAGLLEGIESSEEAEWIGHAHRTEIIADLNNTAQYLRQFVEQITNNVSQLGGLKSFNTDNVLQAITKQGNVLDLSVSLLNAFNTFEAGLWKMMWLIQLAGTRGSKTFTSANIALKKKLSEIDEHLRVIESRSKDVLETETAAKAAFSELEEQTKDVSRIKELAAADRKSLIEYVGTATEKVASITQAYEAGGKLESQVLATETKLREFEALLGQRQQAAEDGQTKLSALIHEFDVAKAQVDDLIAKSEAMLSSATVAGLASEFATTRGQLDKELWWARWSFNGWIVLLLISAVPLFGYVILPLLAGVWPEYLDAATKFGPGSASNGWQYLGNVVARVAVLLPAAWGAMFAARRHASLFSLREHYAYKHSMAVSVEGFKKQAPEYSEAIAASVLEQLAFNPADKLGRVKKEMDIPAPVLKFVLEQIRKKSEA